MKSRTTTAINSRCFGYIREIQTCFQADLRIENRRKKDDGGNNKLFHIMVLCALNKWGKVCVHATDTNRTKVRLLLIAANSTKGGYSNVRTCWINEHGAFNRKQYI